MEINIDKCIMHETEANTLVTESSLINLPKEDIPEVVVLTGGIQMYNRCYYLERAKFNERGNGLLWIEYKSLGKTFTLHVLNS